MDGTGGFSTPGKMPWYGWSIPAKDCVTGSKLAKKEGTVCHGCYALKGRYYFKKVQNALERRLLASRQPGWEQAMVEGILHLQRKTRSGENRFRWFDSGDLQSTEMLRQINRIALATPGVRHWLPTREYKMVREFLATEQLAPNLVVRTSAPWVGKVPGNRLADLPYSTVGAGGEATPCPAPQQGNKCLACDNCWLKKDIDYHLH